MTTTIYALYRNNIPFYIGKSKNPKARLWRHKRTYGEDITMNEIDSVDSLDKSEWKPIESYWIEQFRQWGFTLINQNEGGGGPQGWIEDYAKYQKQYNETDKAKLAQLQWKLNHPNYQKQIQKQYREKNREKCNEYQRQWRAKNPEKDKAYQRQWKLNKTINP